MYKVLLDSNLILKGLQQGGQFDDLWEILKSSERYEGYITDIERSELKSRLSNICELDTVEDILSNISKVLDTIDTSQDDFHYIVSEEMTSLDSNSKNVSIKQFLVRYGLDKIYNQPYEKGANRPVFNNDLLDSHDVGENYLFASSERDSLTGIGNNEKIVGENNDLLDSHDVGENYLFASSEGDFLIDFGNNEKIVGENNDLLDSYDVGENYLFGSSERDFLIDFGNNDENYLFGNDNNSVS